jgi:hypothetical protein
VQCYDSLFFLAMTASSCESFCLIFLCLQWELAYEGGFTSSDTFSRLLHHWPPLDLAGTLVDLYFLNCNGMFPLLHRPTFLRHFADRLYERDIWFACTCMCIFALASRYTHDPRILLDDSARDRLDERAEQSQWQTSGFKYYFLVLGMLPLAARHKMQG